MWYKGGNRVYERRTSFTLLHLLCPREAAMEQHQPSSILHRAEAIHYVFGVGGIISTTDTTFFFTFQKRVSFLSPLPHFLYLDRQKSGLYFQSWPWPGWHSISAGLNFTVVDFGADLTLDQLHCFKISGRMVENGLKMKANVEVEWRVVICRIVYIVVEEDAEWVLCFVLWGVRLKKTSLVCVARVQLRSSKHFLNKNLFKITFFFPWITLLALSHPRWKKKKLGLFQNPPHNTWKGRKIVGGFNFGAS